MYFRKSFPVVFRDEKRTPGSIPGWLSPATSLLFCGVLQGGGFLPNPCHHSPRGPGVWRFGVPGLEFGVLGLRAALGPQRQQVLDLARGEHRAAPQLSQGPASQE